MPLGGTTGGGGGGGFALIGATTAAATVASIAFTGISQAFKSLELLVLCRGDLNASAILNLKLNSDSTAIYDFTNAVGLGTGALTVTAVAATTGARIGSSAPSTAVAGAAGVTRIVIPNYTATTFYKTWVGTAGRKDADAIGNFEQESVWGSWRNTAAVTAVSVQVVGAAGTAVNLLPGSAASLYGMT